MTDSDPDGDAEGDGDEYAGKSLHESIPDPSVDRYPFISENGISQCPYCGDDQHPPVHPVVTPDGARHDAPLETARGDPWYHPDCWKDRKDDLRADENRALNDYT